MHAEFHFSEGPLTEGFAVLDGNVPEDVGVEFVLRYMVLHHLLLYIFIVLLV